MSDFSWDDDRKHFTKKREVALLADSLAPELGINRRSLVVEGKKGEFHLMNAYAMQYFLPTRGIEDEINRHKKLVKEAMG